MIDLNNLIDLFPSYFKENDSYKVDGKGLLERFLNICGEYFQQYPLADLDSFLENLDVNKTNIIFIQNFWKFFGELPFAKGPKIDAEQFINDFTGFNFNDALNKAIRDSVPFNGASDIDYRSLLKYSVSLFKIRGTKRFFEIMFRLYDITCTIGDDTIEDPFETNLDINFDQEEVIFDKATFDHYYRCKECVKVKFSFNQPKATLDFANQMRAFVERFVPFYVTPLIEVSGLNLRQVKIEITPTEPLNIAPEESTTIGVKVTPVISNNTLPSLAYQVAITDIGVDPKNQDWSSPLTLSNYPILSGNKVYHFRPIEDIPQVKSITVNEVYTEVQYMIEKVSPSSKEDLTLSQNNREIELTIKAVKYTYNYKNGKIDGTIKEESADFIWDNAPAGENNQFKGQSVVKVTKAGEQIFSISNLRSRKLRVTIYISKDYENELKSLVLKLKPSYLLIKGANTGNTPDKWANLKPGIYGSDDGETWESTNLETVFEVTDLYGNPISNATIVEINNINNKYKPGDTFTPSVTLNNSNYQFKATYLGVDSKIASLTIYNDTQEAVDATPVSIQVSPESLTLEYFAGHKEVRTFRGEATYKGIPISVASIQAPIIGMRNDKTGEQITTYGLYKEYKSNGTSVYTFEFTAELEGPEEFELRFFLQESDPMLAPLVYKDVPIYFTVPEFYLYIAPSEPLAQWTLNDSTPATGADETFKEGIDLTFTASESWKTAKFSFQGSYEGEITDADGGKYVKDTDYTFEVTADRELVFTAGSQILKVHLRDVPAIVELNINPTEAIQKSPGEYVSTEVWGSTNKSDTFEYTVDDIPYSLANNVKGEYTTNIPGDHVFVAKDDPSKTVIFKVIDPTLP